MRTKLGKTDTIPRARALPALALGLLGALGLTGCGSGGGSGPAPPAPAQQASVTAADRLTLSITEDKAGAAVGEPVTLHVALTNRTPGPIKATFAGTAFGSPKLDPLLVPPALVQDSAGQAVGPDGGPAPPASAPPYRVAIVLASGQSLASTQVYRFTRPGPYTAVAGVRDVDLPGETDAGPLTVTVH